MPINMGDAVLFIKTDLEGLSTGIASAQSQVRKMGSAIASGIAKSTRDMGIALTAIGGATTLALGKAVAAASEFEQAITNAAVVTGKTGEALQDAKEKLDALATTLGQTTVFTAREAANALGILARKGFNVAESSVAALQPFLDLAAATMNDLTFTTDIATSTLRAFGMETKEVSRIADVFVKGANTSALNMQSLGEAMKFVGPIASAAGVSLEETVAALGQLANKGTQASIAGTGLRRSMVTLLNPSGKFAEILRRIGLSTEDVSLKSNGFAEVLAKLKKAGFTTADAMEAFGDRGGVIIEQLAELGKVGTKATDTLKNFRSSLQKAAGVAGVTAKEQLKTLSGQWTLLKSAMESVVIGIGKTVTPALTLLATKAAKVTQDIAKWIKVNPDLVGQITKWAGALGIAALAMGPILIALPLIVGSLVNMATVGAPAVLAVGLAFEKISGIIKSALDDPEAFFDSLVRLGKDFIRDSIANFAEWTFKANAMWVNFRVQAIESWKTVRLLGEIAFLTLQAAWLKFQIAWERGWKKNGDVNEAILEVISLAWDMMWDAIFITVTKAVPKVLKWLGDQFAETFALMTDWISDAIVRGVINSVDRVKRFLRGGGNNITLLPPPPTPPQIIDPTGSPQGGRNSPLFGISEIPRIEVIPQAAQDQASGGGTTSIQVIVNGANIQNEETLAQRIKQEVLQAMDDNQLNFGANA